MLDKSMLYIESFLGEEVDILFRSSGRYLAGDYKIPPSWEAAFTSEAPLSVTIPLIWNQAHGDLGGLVYTLQEGIREIALVLSQKSSFPPHLYYIFRRSTPSNVYWHGWLAGPPLTEERIEQGVARFGFELPASYRSFVQIHNGFLRDGWSQLGLFPLDKIGPLSDKVSSLPPSVTYQPHQLLAFSGDGTGNLQCYNYTMPLAENEYMTVDWDHETREISRPETFWAYTTQFVGKEMGLYAALD